MAVNESSAPPTETPWVRQYRSIKADHHDAILFFRMGDFYEIFYDDAVKAAPILEIALTGRRVSKSGERIPMCGVPHHAAEMYLARLLKAGQRVAICEQVEDPKQAKGLVRRRVVRTVTPGTVVEPSMLTEPTHNFLAAVCPADGVVGLAFIDISTGDFLVTERREDDVNAAMLEELEAMRPAETLFPVSPGHEGSPSWSTNGDTIWQPRDEWQFALDEATAAIKKHYGLQTVAGLGLDAHPEALRAAGAILGYVSETQQHALPHLKDIKPYFSSDRMVLDAATQRNLELFETLRDKRVEGSLWWVVNRTITALGARTLRDWIHRPLTNAEDLTARHDAVNTCVLDHDLRTALRETLRSVADIERLVARLAGGSGNARDLVALRESLRVLPGIKQLLEPCDTPLLKELNTNLDLLPELRDELEAGVVDEPPATITDGNFIRPGYDTDLDHIRELVGDGRDWIASLQESESDRTGISSLKIGYNKVFGYYIEVSKANAHLVPEDYQRKQTLVNAERYVTQQLKEREEEILGAQERMASMEYNLFQRLREHVCTSIPRLQQTASALGALDAIGSFADLAAHEGYTRPVIADTPGIDIRAGRHPVIERMQTDSGFVPNDARLDGQRQIALITGPNMAGKSTYLRQVALIVLLAQAGSFVPAESAAIGIVDRIFTRVGASDNLVRGESTFMVEMIETANILAHATDRSLIVLDEIGRGTSTYDGISIAWAVAEFIHDRIGAYTLFATHYHELAELAEHFPRITNLTVVVREWSGQVVFLYQIEEGSADHSYGIHVAQIAGLPRGVIERARSVMQRLENHDGSVAPVEDTGQMHLFHAAPQSEALDALRRIDPDTLTPKEALDVLYALRRTVDSEPPKA